MLENSKTKNACIIFCSVEKPHFFNHGIIHLNYSQIANKTSAFFLHASLPLLKHQNVCKDDCYVSHIWCHAKKSRNIISREKKKSITKVPIVKLISRHKDCLYTPLSQAQDLARERREKNTSFCIVCAVS